MNDQNRLCCCSLQKITLPYTILACSWMNARTLLTMDSLEKVYLVDVRMGDEMEQSNISNISLIYTSSYYNGVDSQHLVSNISELIQYTVYLDPVIYPWSTCLFWFKLFFSMN